MVKEFDIDSFIDDFLENVKELEEDDEYANLLNWINNEIKEIDVDKCKKK